MPTDIKSDFPNPGVFVLTKYQPEPILILGEATLEFHKTELSVTVRTPKDVFHFGTEFVARIGVSKNPVYQAEWDLLREVTLKVHLDLPGPLPGKLLIGKVSHIRSVALSSKGLWYVVTYATGDKLYMPVSGTSISYPLPTVADRARIRAGRLGSVSLNG